MVFSRPLGRQYIATYQSKGVGIPVPDAMQRAVKRYIWTRNLTCLIAGQELSTPPRSLAGSYHHGLATDPRRPFSTHLPRIRHKQHDKRDIIIEFRPHVHHLDRLPGRDYGNPRCRHKRGVGANPAEGTPSRHDKIPPSQRRQRYAAEQMAQKHQAPRWLVRIVSHFWLVNSPLSMPVDKRPSSRRRSESVFLGNTDFCDWR